MTDMPVWQVVTLGIGTVFVVLICIIIICKLMSVVIRAFEKKPAPVVASAPVAVQAAPTTPNKQQLVAAIGVAIAETMGTDVSHIKIHSIKKI